MCALTASHVVYPSSFFLGSQPLATLGRLLWAKIIFDIFILRETRHSFLVYVLVCAVCILNYRRGCESNLNDLLVLRNTNERSNRLPLVHSIHTFSDFFSWYSIIDAKSIFSLSISFALDARQESCYAFIVASTHAYTLTTIS